MIYFKRKFQQNNNLTFIGILFIFLIEVAYLQDLDSDLLKSGIFRCK